MGPQESTRHQGSSLVMPVPASHSQILCKKRFVLSLQVGRLIRLGEGSLALQDPWKEFGGQQEHNPPTPSLVAQLCLPPCIGNTSAVQGCYLLAALPTPP